MPNVERARKNNRARRERLLKRGCKDYTVTAHHEDIEVIRRFARNLLSLHTDEDEPLFTCTISTRRPIE